MKVSLPLFCVTLAMFIVTVGFSQSGTPAGDIHVADDAITNDLRKEGIKYETNRAIIWVEKGGLSQEEIKDFAKLVNRGITDIEKYTGIKFDKQHYQANKIEYFLSALANDMTDSSE